MPTGKLMDGTIAQEICKNSETGCASFFGFFFFFAFVVFKCVGVRCHLIRFQKII